MPKAARRKTFSSKEKADEHAKAKNLENYAIEPAKKNKRFKIVV